MDKVTNSVSSKNINTKSYWDRRFSTGDWEEKGGRKQTRAFALAQVPHIHVAHDFSGTLVDFGCGLGDAIPIYRRSYPLAKLIGVDISANAIEKCRARYGHIAAFICGTHQDVPIADLIIASNVLEHLSDDVVVTRALLAKCRQLYVVVPYKEDPLCSEHLRSYDENYYKGVNEYNATVFISKGWSEFGISLLKLALHNCIALVTGKHLRRRNKQIIFEFSPRI